MPRLVSAFRLARTSSILSLEVTCAPSPGGRLSRPQTPTGTPLPWGAPPEGQARAARIRHVLARFRSSPPPSTPARCWLWRSRATAFASARPSRRSPSLCRREPPRYPAFSAEPSLSGPSTGATIAAPRGLPGGGPFCCRPGLDFKQCSLDHAARAWRGEYPLVGSSPASPAGCVPLGLVGYG
jgi:hypothetical protein